MSSYTTLYYLRYRVAFVRRMIDTSLGCDVCGKTRKGGKLFQYGILDETDRTHFAYPVWHTAPVCSKRCFDKSRNGSWPYLK